MPVFDRVLVANRGEIAVRVIRAAHELGIEAVAVYSTADRDALHVRLADHAVCIGPPAAAESYLRISNVVAAAETTGCDAIHPGYGFLAENAEFVHACVDNNLVFIGPTADVVEQMGDKVRAKEAMREAGVPLVPGSDGEIGPEALRRAAAAAGFPVLLKASAGGGGKGMRLVFSEDELEDAFAGASAEAEAAFGDGAIYVEKLVAPARHVEIQVLCDAAGGVLTLGERECSIQRRHQKLIEESPSSALDPATREAMESTVASACEAIGYRNAGHVRVPRRPGRRVLLHRGELPSPGRASGVRARHRNRHRARADPDRVRVRRSPSQVELRGAVTRSRSASTRRIRREGSCPRPGR